MGDNLAAGEVRQLLVEGGWWKVSEIPPEDRVAVKEGKADPGRTGALISEVVTPGESMSCSPRLQRGSRSGSVLIRSSSFGPGNK